MKKGTIKSMALYSIANYLYTGLNAIANIFVSNILGPVGNGVISYYTAINTNVNAIFYGAYRSSMEREIPQMPLWEDKVKFAQQAHSLSIISALIISFLFLVMGFLTLDPIMSCSAYFVSAVSLVTCLADFYRIWNKSLNRISLVSYIMIVSSFLIPVSSIVLSLLFNINGFWFGRIITNFVILLSYVLVTKFIFGFVKPEIAFVKRIFVSGGEIVLFSLFSTGISTMDRFFVKGTVGIEQLGYYAIGSMVLTMLMLVPHSLTGSIFPRFVGLVNENLKNKVDKFSLFLEYGSLAISVVVFFITPTLLKWFMPKYMDSIPFVRILLVAFAIYSGVQIRYIDIIRKKQMRLLIKNAAIAFTIGVIAFSMVSLFLPSTINLAWCTVFCFVLLSVATYLAWEQVYKIENSKMVVDILFSLCSIICILPIFVFSEIYAILISVALGLLTFSKRYKRLQLC